MAAVFPRSIKAFSTKRNLFDDVDASDINAMQEEIVALESVLGVLLNDFEDLEAEFEESQDEQEGLEDDLRRNRLRFTNLRSRLDFIQQGRHQPCVELVKTTFPVGSSPSLPDMPTRVDFPKPTYLQDPDEMFNGTGITLRKGGWWRISGQIIYDVRSAPPPTDMYVGAIGINGDHVRGLDRRYPPPSNNTNPWNPTLMPYVEGQFDRGTRITLRTSHSSGGSKTVKNAFLTACWVRRMSPLHATM